MDETEFLKAKKAFANVNATRVSLS